VNDYLLTQEDFPGGEFFTYLRKGVEYYQRDDFQLAIWEWFSASRINDVETVDIKRYSDPAQLQCKLKDVSLLLFLYTIYLNKLSGVAHIYHSNTIQKIVFKNGFICFFENINQHNRIGYHILKKRNDIPYSDLKNFILQARREGKRIGEYMTDNDLLEPHDLEDILAQQVLESVGELLRIQEGDIYFTEKEIKEKPQISSTPLKMAFQAAQRRFDEPQFRRQAADTKTIFRPRSNLNELKDKLRKKLNSHEVFVLSLVDGFRNIDQIARFSGTNAESIVNILYRLSKIGLIRMSRESAEYEDKEYEDISRILGLIFDVYGSIYTKLYAELGRKAQEIVSKSKSSLDVDRQNLFEGIVLHDAECIDKSAILGNIAKHYPFVEQRVLFIDIFGELFDVLLRESKRFLGNKLSKGLNEELRRKISDVENLSLQTIYSERLLTTLKNLVYKHG
jgi:hypothetical protein